MNEGNTVRIEKARFKLTVAPGTGSVTLEFLPDSGATGKITFDFDQLSKHIQHLGQARIAIHPATAPKLADGTQVAVVYNPEWFVQLEPLTEGSVLLLYNPAYGRLGFVLPRNEVAAIVHLLSAHLTLPAADKSKLN